MELITIFLLLCVVIWTVGYIGEKQHDGFIVVFDKLTLKY